MQSVPGLQLCRTSANGSSWCVDPWGKDQGSHRARERVMTHGAGQVVACTVRCWGKGLDFRLGHSGVFPETLESGVPGALASAAPRWESSLRAHTLLGPLGGSLQASWGKGGAKLIWDRAPCSAWALSSFCDAESQGLPLFCKRLLSKKKLKAICHCRGIKCLFDSDGWVTLHLVLIEK